MNIYRIVASKWADSLLKASGRPARWNSKGVEVVYFAESRSLACLENIVHRSALNLSSVQFSLVIVKATENIKEIKLKDLPSGWNGIDESAYRICRPFGDNWIYSCSSLLLKVPSVIAPGEFNYLVNPRHPEVKRLKTIEIIAFKFDSRVV
jgi:RES domain-containing protein